MPENRKGSALGYFVPGLVLIAIAFVLILVQNSDHL
jgi:hypothetical protein